VKYQLFFLDDEGCALDSCEADINAEALAVSWMCIVGSAWSAHHACPYYWSRVELRRGSEFIASASAAIFAEWVSSAVTEADHRNFLM